MLCLPRSISSNVNIGSSKEPVPTDSIEKYIFLSLAVHTDAFIPSFDVLIVCVSRSITERFRSPSRIGKSIWYCESLILIPDQKVTVDKNGNCKVTPIYDYDPYKWRDGLICFQSESFESIMKTFENQFGMSISINNTSILNNEFTGKFRQTDGLEYALKILQKNVNFKYEINKNTQSVIIN